MDKKTKEVAIKYWNEIKNSFIQKALDKFDEENIEDPTGNIAGAYIMAAEDEAWEKAVEMAEVNSYKQIFITERTINTKLEILRALLNYLIECAPVHDIYELKWKNYFDCSYVMKDIDKWDKKMWAKLGWETHDYAGNPGYWYSIPVGYEGSIATIEFGVFYDIPDPTDLEEKMRRIDMSMTQYDLYSDFCKKCKEEGIAPYLTEKEYIEGFNSAWYCPEGYKTAYDRCLAWHWEAFLSNLKNKYK